MYNNNIKNIDALSSLVDCKITIAKNSIDNLEIIDNTTISFLSRYGFRFYAYDSGGKTFGGRSIDSHPQYLSISTEEKSVQLPKIFLQAKDPNSKLYTEEEFELVNCTLSKDGTSLILDEGISEATIKIVGGKIFENNI